MNKKNRYGLKILIGLLFLSALAYGIKKFYNEVYFSKTNQDLTLKVHYIESCGDCPAVWKVDSVLGELNDSFQLINKEMFVIYKGKRLESQLGKINWKCILCSDFYVKGDVKNTLSGKYKFLAHNYNYTVNPNCCLEKEKDEED
jgi:hypothetical protein